MPLVDNPEQVIKNIQRYSAEVDNAPRLAELMGQHVAWYALRSAKDTWLFGPSKFVGYAENTAQEYLETANVRSGIETERVLTRELRIVEEVVSGEPRY